MHGACGYECAIRRGISLRADSGATAGGWLVGLARAAGLAGMGHADAGGAAAWRAAAVQGGADSGRLVGAGGLPPRIWSVPALGLDRAGARQVERGSWSAIAQE